MRTKVALVLMAGLLIAAKDAKEDAAKAELKKLEGHWKAEREELKGNLIRTGAGVLIEGKDFQTLYRGDQRGHLAKITAIDPTKTPKTIDLEIQNGSFRGKTQLGIYRIKGDKLEICLGNFGSDKRPTKFTSKTAIGRGDTYLIYKKVKE